MPSPYKSSPLADSLLTDENTSILVSPNPSNSEVAITYQLTSDQKVKLEIIDNSGKSVIVLADDFQEKGVHSQKWNSSRYAAGAYFVKITKSDAVEMKRLLISH